MKKQPGHFQHLVPDAYFQHELGVFQLKVVTIRSSGKVVKTCLDFFETNHLSLIVFFG